MAVMDKARAGRGSDAQADEKRKKIILAVASVVLVGVLAFQGPRVLKQLRGTSAATPAPSTSAPAPSAPGIDSTGGGATAPAPTAVPPLRSGGLPALKARDPFTPLIRENAGGSGSADSAKDPAPASTDSSPGPGPAVGFEPGNPTAPTTTVAPPSPVAAVIWINDSPQIIGLSKRFPSGAPTFKLVSVSPKLIKIRVAGGSFADGRKVITIRKGRGITLVNTATGVRYDIRFAASTSLNPTLTQPGS